MTINVAGTFARAGEIVRGSMRVGSMADGSPIALPFFIAQGAPQGPVVWLQGGIHGDEYGGTAAILSFIKDLDVASLKGTIIAFPVVNPPAFNARARRSTIDGYDINRIFPGGAGGTYSGQLAHALCDAIVGMADYLLDLHSGGMGIELPFSAIFKDEGGSEVSAKSRELAEQVGCSWLWLARVREGLSATMTAEVARRGIPSVTIECGGGTLTPEHKANFQVAIQGFMRASGVMPGEAPRQARYTVVSDGTYLHNREGGLFVPACKIGEILAEGALMGTVVNLHGDIVEEIRCPHDKAYTAALRTDYFPVNAGENVAIAIPVQDDAG